MYRPLSLFIGLRYTRSKRRNHFIAFVSTTSMAGITLGVMVLIVVLSVMNGFDHELRTRILGSIAHGRVQATQPFTNWRTLREQVLTVPNVVAVAPLTRLQALLSHGGSTAPAIIQGIEPELESQMNVIADNMVAGSFDDLAANQFGIIIGNLLARSLGLRVGDSVTVILPEASVTPVGLVPRLKRMQVVGVFALGAQLDSGVGFIHIHDAAKLKKHPKGSVESLQLHMEDLFLARQTVIEAGFELGQGFIPYDWTSTYGNLFASIQLEKRMVGLLLFLIVAVAAFNMVSTLVMTVTDKQSDIAILRTMGASSLHVVTIFIIQGSFIGFIGTLLGTVLGVLGALYISNILSFLETVLQTKFLDAQTYFIDYFPSRLLMEDVLVITSVALALSLLATIYPALRAAKIQPADALRYE